MSFRRLQPGKRVAKPLGRAFLFLAGPYNPALITPPATEENIA